MLHIVATPIGNLGDMTTRAIETLRAVDLVASEDTRKTGLLLRHFGIDARQVSFHEHNERVVGARLIGQLQAGTNVALVTNAGTPGVSDPGFTLVRAAIAADIPITMEPGPTAFVTAIVLSGLPVHSFTFRGFPPRRSGPRRRFFEVDRESPHTLVFYESPYRLIATLDDALAVFGDRACAVANDLTKKFERIDRGRVTEVRAALQAIDPRGEYAIVIAGAEVG